MPAAERPDRQPGGGGRLDRGGDLGLVPRLGPPGGRGRRRPRPVPPLARPGRLLCHLTSIYCASMSVDQGRKLTTRPRQASSTSSAEAQRGRYDRATAALDPPLALVDLDAFDRNAADLTRRAGHLPIRVATKSLRCRYLIERALARPGYQGVMCYSLAEALWLHAAGTSNDVLVAYPTVDRTALRALAADEEARQHVTIMVDSAGQLDVVDQALGDGHPELRVCLELDVSWRPLAGRPLVHIGTRRSPLFSPRQAADFAAAVTRRPGFRLVGVMGYEGQIAGLGDAPPGHP